MNVVSRQIRITEYLNIPSENIWLGCFFPKVKYTVQKEPVNPAGCTKSNKKFSSVYQIRWAETFWIH